MPDNYRVPWNGLGVPVSGSVEDILSQSGIDWTVSKTPTYIKVGQDKLKDTQTQALIRDEDYNIFSMVGPTWTPTQNYESMTLFKAIAEKLGRDVTYAGSLKGGEIIWALVDTGIKRKLFEGDLANTYILFSNQHMYGKGIEARICIFRYANHSTFILPPDTKTTMRISIEDNPADVARTLEHYLLTETYRFKELANHLGSVEYITETAKEYLGKVFGFSAKKGLARTAETVYDILEEQPGNLHAKGTFWQLLNSVAFSIDHILGRTPDTRLTSAWFGTNAKRKLDAIRIANDMTS